MQPGNGPCMIVIFPGIRIERHEQSPGINLGHRVTESAGRGDFDDLGGGHLPRKTS